MRPALGLGDARVKEAGDRAGEVLARRLKRADEDGYGAAGALLAEGAGRGRGTRARRDAEDAGEAAWRGTWLGGGMTRQRQIRARVSWIHPFPARNDGDGA